MRALSGSGEDSNRTWFVVTPVVIRSGADYTAQERVGLINGLKLGLSGGQIATGFEEMRKLESKTQLRLRIGFQLGFTAYDPLLDRPHHAFIGDTADVGENFARSCTTDNRPEQGFDIGVALLSTKNADPQLEHVGIIRRAVHASRGLLVART